MTLPKAILFDMDGTLTAPMLDFAAIKAEMGIGPRAILEAMAEMTGEPLRRAQAVLDRHEDRAAAESTLNPGCCELLAWLAERRMPTALITRNSRRSAETVIALHGLQLDVVISRDDAPHKPDPAPLRLACQRLDVEPTQTWMVGDGRYDIEAGAAAGIPTVWLSHGKRRLFDAEPTREVRDLAGLLYLLRTAEAEKSGSGSRGSGSG